jgi:hypothetical protein
VDPWSREIRSELPVSGRVRRSLTGLHERCNVCKFRWPKSVLSRLRV